MGIFIDIFYPSEVLFILDQNEVPLNLRVNRTPTFYILANILRSLIS